MTGDYDPRNDPELSDADDYPRDGEPVDDWPLDDKEQNDG